jgi:glyoxylase-like metal-dependent hydrolase (beta-lactamase superfamily II)
MIQVSKNIFVENSLPYCNLGLISTTDGLVMVDTPMNPIDAVKWRDVMQARGTIKYIINTEEHGDHCTNSWFYPRDSRHFGRDYEEANEEVGDRANRAGEEA